MDKYTTIQSKRRSLTHVSLVPSSFDLPASVYFLQDRFHQVVFYIFSSSVSIGTSFLQLADSDSAYGKLLLTRSSLISLLRHLFHLYHVHSICFASFAEPTLAVLAPRVALSMQHASGRANDSEFVLGDELNDSIF